MRKEYVMGNGAIALGALAAGLNLVAGYPGTPSSEILETVAKYPHDRVHVEWSVNEKAAMEVAASASYSGARTLVTMKQVGLNVASDPLMSLAYVGIKGGMVIVSADDPGPISSQTEQDTRMFADFCRIPVFDPSTPEEAYQMIQDAFDYSEKYKTPVLFRPTTRVCHAYASIEVKDEWKAKEYEGFVKDSKKWVIFPRLSFANHAMIEKRNVEIGDDCVIMSYASILQGTKMGKGNKVHQNAVLGAEPQDFHYTGEESSLIIGDNNDIRENVVISRATFAGNATRIGNGNYLMDKVHLCHDVQISNNCVVGIGTTIAGECSLDDCVILSGNVTLHQYCHIGSWTLVQSGCRISKDVPPYVIMSGNPVAYHGVNAVVLSQHHNTSERILRHIANAYRLIYQGNFSVQDAVQKIIDQVPMSEEIENIVNFVKGSERGIVK